MVMTAEDHNRTSDYWLLFFLIWLLSEQPDEETPPSLYPLRKKQTNKKNSHAASADGETEREEEAEPMVGRDTGFSFCVSGRPFEAGLLRHFSGAAVRG